MAERRVAASTAVLEVLNNAVAQGKALTLPAGLDPKLYRETNRILELAGGKWDRRAGAHVFRGDAGEAIEPVLLTGGITDERRTFEVFYTPPNLAIEIARTADIDPGMSVLEPSAGNGALAVEARGRGGAVHCVEIRAEAVDHLKLMGFAVEHADFLSLTPSGFDRVLMNPPFSGQQDVRHVLHALTCLRPGGRLVAVMSPTWLTSDRFAARQLREALSRHGWVTRPLPDGSFKASGTMVNAIVLTVIIGDGADG